MQFENRQPADGINAPPEHPLKEFTQLLIAVGLTCVALVALLTYIAGQLAHHIPFRYEQDMVANISWLEPQQNSSEQQRLQAILDQVVVNMGLPNDMQITVHYSDDTTVNAFATLGGHIVMFKGLLDQLPNEQAIAAVLAHEIAHVKLRHPIVAAGRGFTLLTLGAVISGSSSSTAGQWLIGSSTNLQLMQFSRKQELAADRLAAEAMLATYGSIDGLLAVFDLFTTLEADSAFTALDVEALRSHPYSHKRRRAIEKIAPSSKRSQQH
ncbi:M48 family metallopeptidase [Arenicella xantha]|uniref:Peptidase M48-like protein n=1 Tax=Arenicella xantha TaxID=644221 RepID=A0A395JHW8_9GAMM|nr:M48 family metallopeptidase [Arenicella xantha]RBP47105.1 peptidase M48-like protein [Arenicella xantha]